MIEIKDLLKRFDEILLKGEYKKDTIRNIISNEIGLDIKREEFQIKNNIIYLDIKPIYKNEIFIKMEKIQEKLNEVFGQRSPQNIR
jgi:hypothetical protein